MLQQLVEHVNSYALNLLGDKTLKNPLAYIEVTGISDVEITGAEALITVTLRKHLKSSHGSKETQQALLMEDATTVFDLSIDGDDEGYGEMSEEEVQKACKQFLHVLQTRPFAVNLLNRHRQACELNQLPAKTPFVAYVGNRDVKFMEKVYVGVPNVKVTDADVIKSMLTMMASYTYIKTEQREKVYKAVELKGGKELMANNKFKLIATNPMLFWTKSTVLDGMKVRMYVTPFMALAVSAKGEFYWVYDKMKFTLDSCKTSVTKRDLNEMDKSTLLALLDMTDLRKKAPKMK